MRGRLLLVLLPLAGACSEQPTQALVEVELSAELLQNVGWVEANFADPQGQPTASSLHISLAGADAETVPFSFGVVPDRERNIRVLLRAYDRAQPDRVLHEKLVTGRLDANEKRYLNVVLTCADSVCKKPLAAHCAGDDECGSGACAEGVCCLEPCAGDCFSCSVAGFEGRCMASDPPASELHCGGCGQRCSSTHVATPHCTAGLSSPATPDLPAVCDGMCEPGFDHCGQDPRLHGCSIDLRTDPSNCRVCGMTCPFGVCVGGSCKASALPAHSGGGGEVSWPANRMFGTMLFANDPLHIAGLGIKLRTGAGYPVARFKLALYRAGQDSRPGTLIQQTGELSTDMARWPDLGIVSDGVDDVDGGIQVPIQHTEIAANTYYYMFFIADAPVYLVSQDYQVPWYASPDGALTYAGSTVLPQQPGGNYPVLEYGVHPLGALYPILIPETQIPETQN